MGFYPQSEQTLRRQVDLFLSDAEKEVSIDAQIAIAPHAGYVYSGATAALTFRALKKQIEKKDATVIIIGPNHTGLGKPVSISFDDWKTPLGNLSVDLRLAAQIIKSNTIIEKNEVAHLREHCIEVMLPFIQRINPNAKIIPICIGLGQKQVCVQIAKAIFEASKKDEFKDRNITFLASSDFTHYQSAQTAQKMDKMPIEYIKQLNSDEFYREVLQNELSICGVGPIICAIEYAKLCAKKKAILLRYTNSAKQSGTDDSQVVAYASMAFV